MDVAADDEGHLAERLLRDPRARDRQHVGPRPARQLRDLFLQRVARGADPVVGHCVLTVGRERVGHSEDAHAVDVDDLAVDHHDVAGRPGDRRAVVERVVVAGNPVVRDRHVLDE